MSDPGALPPLREIIEAHGLRAKKSLGQNFLLDLNITDKIVRSAGDLHGVTVFEIGPGPGGLTRSLLKSGAEKIVAVEFDERAVRALDGLKKISGGRLEVIHGDALKINLSELAPKPQAIVANLPYNIATVLLMGWLKQIREEGAYQSMTLMFQKEVAQRLVAAPASKAYGRLAVMAGWLCDVEKMFDLPPAAFTPSPKVSSSVVRFVSRKLPDDAPSFKVVEKITAAAFGQRRKMLRSSLKSYRDALAGLGIDETLRAEDVPVADYIKLASFTALP